MDGQHLGWSVIRGSVAIAALSLAGVAAAQSAPPSQAEPVGAPATTAVAPDLAPGAFEWRPDASPAGDTLIVVSLPQQLMHVYRGGVRIGVSTVSTGRPGFETPTGVFTILQKEVEHASNLYDDAPMPYMQRLTWSGVALHAGALPGYPASHGCIRLPGPFAKLLYEATNRATVVIVADYASFAPDIVAPGPVVTADMLAAASRANPATPPGAVATTPAPPAAPAPSNAQAEPAAPAEAPRCR